MWHLETGETALDVPARFRMPPLGRIEPAPPHSEAKREPPIVATAPSEPRPTEHPPPEPAPSSSTGGNLHALRQEALGCDRCNLAQGRGNVVFGTGDLGARILFVGDQPSAGDDARGEPFTGDDGELLVRMIAAMGLDRKQVYLVNIIKCRPPEDADPAPEQLAACAPWLEKQIDLIRPEVIVGLGSLAAGTLLTTTASLPRLRGRWHAYRGIPVMVTFHPGFVLRAPRMKRPVWEDLKKVMARLGLRPPRRG